MKAPLWHKAQVEWETRDRSADFATWERICYGLLIVGVLVALFVGW